MTKSDTPVRVTVVPRPAITTHTETPTPQSVKPLDDPGGRRATIKAAIEQLDLSDQTHVTEDGKPDATVLSDLLGWQVSARERDAVWAEMEPSPGRSRTKNKE